MKRKKKKSVGIKHNEKNLYSGGNGKIHHSAHRFSQTNRFQKNFTTFLGFNNQ